MIQSPVPTNTRLLYLPLLLLLITAFYILTIRAGHHWGDDFALYIHHARNMAEGIPYTSTGYVPNPHVPQLGPLVYPPGFPVLLLPVYKLFGLNLTAMKIEEILCLTGGLFCIFLLFSERLPYDWALALVACFALTPFVWTYRDNILSDFPFVFFTYGSLLLIQRFCDPGKLPRRASAVPVGLSIYIAYAIRPLGLLILFALIAYELIRYRRISGFTCLTVAVMAIPAIVQAVILPGDTRFDQFSFRPRWLLSSLIIYIKYDRSFWQNDFSNLLSYALFAVVVILTVMGLWVQIRMGIRIYDVFIAMYLVVVIAYTDPQDRYLIPIQPVLLLYAFLGLRRLAAVCTSRLSGAVIVTLTIVTSLSFGSMYAHFGRSPLDGGISDPAFVQVCAYIRAKTRPTDIFIFRKPRLLSLMSDRSASVYQVSDYASLWNYIVSIHASYLIFANVSDQDFAADRTYLPGFIASRKEHFTRAYQSGPYQVFRIDTNTP